jgi:hypothetical protein
LADLLLALQRLEVGLLPPVVLEDLGLLGGGLVVLLGDAIGLTENGLADLGHLAAGSELGQLAVAPGVGVILSRVLVGEASVVELLELRADLGIAGVQLAQCLALEVVVGLGEEVLGEVLGGATGPVLGALGLGPDSTIGDGAQALLSQLGIGSDTADFLGDAAGIAAAITGVGEVTELGASVLEQIGIDPDLVTGSAAELVGGTVDAVQDVGYEAVAAIDGVGDAFGLDLGLTEAVGSIGDAGEALSGAAETVVDDVGDALGDAAGAVGDFFGF